MHLIRERGREREGEGLEGGGLDYTVTTRMTPPLKWAAMRAILMFQ